MQTDCFGSSLYIEEAEWPEFAVPGKYPHDRVSKNELVLDSHAGGGYVEAAKVSPTEKRITSPRLEMPEVSAGALSRSSREGCRAGTEESSVVVKEMDLVRAGSHWMKGGSTYRLGVWFHCDEMLNSVTDQTNNHRRGWS
jgi:hypothetical protein